MELLIYKDKDQAVEALAIHFIKSARKAILANGRFSFVLAGGSTPKDFYKLLAKKYADAIDWQKVYFFLGDERNVPADSDDYNGKMVMDSLLLPLKIVPEHIYFYNTSDKVTEAAQEYMNEINRYFDGKRPVFDFVLLGMGNDGHTASLFPSTDVLDAKEAYVKAYWVEKLNTYRYTFTAPLINEAAEIVFLVCGSEKASALKSILDNATTCRDYPAKLINPTNGKLYWFLDEKATKELNLQ